MSSDNSDSEFEQDKCKDEGDGDSDTQIQHRASFKGPQTPKSSPRSSRSPRSPPTSPRSQYSGGLGSPLSDSQGPMSPPVGQGRGPRSPPSPPPDIADDDGRSDISSGSSLLSHDDNKDEELLNFEPGDNDNMQNMQDIASPPPPVKPSPPPPKNFPISTADDLSDVSDLDDSDGLDDEEEDDKNADAEGNRSEVVQEKEKHTGNAGSPRETQKDREQKNSLNVDDGEQLDFEADDQPEEKEKEEGEIETAERKDSNSKKEEEDEGEVKEDDAESLEDGEVTDEGDPKPEKPPVCRFYSRGACTWGINCRFLHPGVTDKGNYTMFDVGRPMVATPNGGVYPAEHRVPYSHHMMLPPSRVVPGPYGPVPMRREDPALVESAWERGLRQAKEMMRKSTKRKETDMDFEEKKMNLSIGQEEIDKENDYYTRAASPVEDPQGWVRGSPKLEPEIRRPAVRIVERYEDIVAEPVSPAAFYDKYDYRRGFERAREVPPEYLRREKMLEEEEYAAHKKARREKTVREVIVQRVEKPVRERHHEEGVRRKPDEWADPWMRSKSPSRKTGPPRQRKTSYSSGSSSLSSRSGSRSSSNSSYSSYSRSRSRSLSNSRSPAPSRSRRPKTPPYPTNSKAVGRSKKPTSPKDGKFRPLKTAAPVEKKITVERSMLMNPPAPTPKRAKERPLSPSQMRKVGLNPPPPTPKVSSRNPQKIPGVGRKTGKIRSRKSRSSSGSGSSGSSSESSRSSYTSSTSSSRGGTPPMRPMRPVKPGKKIEPNERLAAQSLKGTAMDALKVSGQKPQIKLTLKPNDAKREKVATPLMAGKKRPAEEPAAPEPKAPPGKPMAAKKTTSRREELLKQLKAVEDAIARKRSKI